MANPRILYNTDAWTSTVYGGGAVITGSNETGNGQARKVTLDPPAEQWNTGTGNDTAEWLKWDLGSAKLITMLNISGANWSAAAEVRWQGNATDSWGSPTYNQLLTLATDADGNVLPRHTHFLSETFRWWRLYIDDAANAENRIKISSALGGQYYEFERGMTRGARWTLKDPSTIKHLPGSVEEIQAADRLKKYRQARIDFKRITTSEHKKFEAIFSKIGNSRPCVLALDPTNNPTEMTAFCYLMSDIDLVWDMYNRHDALTMTFEEKTR